MDDLHDFIERIYPYGRHLSDLTLTSSYRETLNKIVYAIANNTEINVPNSKSFK